jgi:hypothetical protein
MEKSSPTKGGKGGRGGGRGKGKSVQSVTGRGGRGDVKRKMSKSLRAGLTFPVTRIRRYLRGGRYAKIIGQGASVYLGTLKDVATTVMPS